MKKILSIVGALGMAAGLSLLPASSSLADDGSLPAVQGAATYQNTAVPSAGVSTITIDAHGHPGDAGGVVRNINTTTLNYWQGNVVCMKTNADATEGRITGVITSGNLNPPVTVVTHYFTVTYKATAVSGDLASVNQIAVNHRITKPYNCNIARVPLHQVVGGSILIQHETA
jgi:hypothetical protein